LPKPATETRYEVKCKDGTFYTPSLDLAQRYARCNKGKITEVVETWRSLPVPRKEKPVKKQ
jgi:hypothetical protein